MTCTSRPGTGLNVDVTNKVEAYLPVHLPLLISPLYIKPFPTSINSHNQNTPLSEGCFLLNSL